jgi:hypothetical protein
MVAMHHAFILSAHTLIFDDSRGSSKNLISEGFGFTQRDSVELGGELGYHYWVDEGAVLRGPFLGPSFVFGVTQKASVGDPTSPQGYFGLALDVGWQEVFDGGFTIGAGAGVELLHGTGTTAVVPRILGQVGYAF